MTLLTRPSLLPSTSTFFNDFFDDMRFPSLNLGNGFKNLPSANIIETDKAFNIELAAPGMKKNDFEITVDNGQLTISSEKEEEKEEKDENYTRHEFSYNSFSRSFLLPDWVDADKIKAKYEDGILTLAIPKKPEATKTHKKAISIS
ncbi:Hsp20/alpha crystallin family protein [Fulvivirga sp.]|uniref:Hsp20/alpha crystallin family protein n=1 Tax=Fulvivirga sp. TaxID=1931237 RepID=UPI0032ED5D9B